MIKAIVTDIEGTTSSLSFVKDVLFPYARAHLPDYVRDHQQQPEVAQILSAVSRECGRNLSIDESIAQLIDWIDRDQKITPLKSLQGLIWEAGYRQGDYLGHIYADAVEALHKWKKRGIELYVYSSGSVFAQKLLFAHTEYGDLTVLFSGYFDTRIGGKKEVGSYQSITEEVDLPASQILFLSDIKEELDAAHQAGLHTCWLVREQLVSALKAGHYQAKSFAEIDLAKIGAL